MQFHFLNWVDLFIIAVIGLSALVSLIRGFVREALSLVGWGIAVWVAISYSTSLAALLQGHIPQATLRMAVAFAILFVVTLILAAIVNHLISQFIVKTGLSSTDKMIGVFFGLGRGVFLVTLLLLLGSMTPLPKQEAWHTSVLVPAFHPAEQWLAHFLPDKITTRLPGQAMADQVDNLPISREN